MSTTSADATDRGVGLSILFGVLAVAGAFAIWALPGTQIAGWGFAVATLSAALVVVTIHLYPD